MKLKREKLLGILESVKPGIAKKEIIEETSNFIFHKNRIITYNDKVCVIHPLKCGFTCSVPSQEIYSIVKKLNDDLIVLKYEDDMLHIKTATTQAELAVTAESQIIELVDQFPEIESWKKMPKELLEAFKWCMFSASKNASIPYLTAVFVSKGFVMATDELRVSMYTLSKKMPVSFMIPAESVKYLLSFKPTSYSIVEGWAFFKNEDNVMFCTRTIEGKYPAKKYADEFEFIGKPVILPARLVNALDVTQVLAEGDLLDEKRVNITIKEGTMFVSAEKQDIGKIKKKMKVKYKKKAAITMTINPIFLSEILTKTNKVTIGPDRALFASGNFKHLVSLYVEE